MVTISMMSAKMATQGYDVTIYVHDFTNKILSRGSSYIVNLHVTKVW